MANNRMFLVHKGTGERVMLAKYYPSTGWYPPAHLLTTLSESFDRVCFRHLTDAEREEQLQSLSNICVPTPSKAQGGIYGERWEIEYETDPST